MPYDDDNLEEIGSLFDDRRMYFETDEEESALPNNVFDDERSCTKIEELPLNGD
jgi:hypothetical protein